jgi:ankyrin repeat protein
MDPSPTKNGLCTPKKICACRCAELESKNKYGQTPLSYADRNRYEAKVKPLFEKGAELDNNGQTLL